MVEKIAEFGRHLFAESFLNRKACMGETAAVFFQKNQMFPHYCHLDIFSNSL